MKKREGQQLFSLSPKDIGIFMWTKKMDESLRKFTKPYMKLKNIEVQTGCYYKSSKTKYIFKVIAIHRDKNYCYIVDKNQKHHTVPLDDINNSLIKGKIIKN